MNKGNIDKKEWDHPRKGKDWRISEASCSQETKGLNQLTLNMQISLTNYSILEVDEDECGRQAQPGFT